MDKQVIRDEALRRLKTLSSKERASWSQSLTEKLVATEAYQASRTLATYLSMPHEFDTNYLIERAQQDKKRIFIPKTYSQGRMDFVEYNPSDLVKSSFDIWEPKTYSQPVDKSVINLIHVPGLAWNRAGFRIGYGGGFYDRYLLDFQGTTISTLVAFQQYDFEQDRFDIPVKEMLVFEDDI